MRDWLGTREAIVHGVIMNAAGMPAAEMRHLAPGPNIDKTREKRKRKRKRKLQKDAGKKSKKRQGGERAGRVT